KSAPLIARFQGLTDLLKQIVDEKIRTSNSISDEIEIAKFVGSNTSMEKVKQQRSCGKSCLESDFVGFDPSDPTKENCEALAYIAAENKSMYNHSLNISYVYKDGVESVNPWNATRPQCSLVAKKASYSPHLEEQNN